VSWEPGARWPTPEADYRCGIDKAAAAAADGLDKLTDRNDSAFREEVAGDSEEAASDVGAEYHASSRPDKVAHSVEDMVGVHVTSRGLEGGPRRMEGSSRCGDSSDTVDSFHRDDAFSGGNVMVMAIVSVRVHMKAMGV
jgi:hypothetical protein